MTGNPLSTSAIVITGSAMSSALGVEREETWRRVLGGQRGFGPLSALEQTPATPKGGGEAPPLHESAMGEPSAEPASASGHSAALAEAKQGAAHATEAREARYLRHAIRSAMTEAGIAEALPYASARCGLVFGTTLHGMRAAGAFLRTGETEKLRGFQAGAVLQAAAGDLGLTGLGVTTCAACSSGLSSVGLAMTLLRAGELDLVIAGGYDPISEYAYAGFNSLRLVTAGQPRPFCEGRDGMKLGEAYGAIVLERDEEAQQRGAPRQASVLGLGESADAYHLTRPHPEGRGAIDAMREALTAADLGPDAIGLISAHGTGTPDNEAGEAAALRAVFGDRLGDTPIAALKSQLGHTLGGAGTAELILAMGALRDGVVPPSPIDGPSLEWPDLCFADRPRRAAIDATMNLSIGFGGANTCVILGKPPAGMASEDTHDKNESGSGSLSPRERAGMKASSITAEQPEPPRPDPLPRGRGEGTGVPRSISYPTGEGTGDRHEAVITGVGVVLPGIIGHEAFVRRLAEANEPVSEPPGSVDEAALAALIDTRRVRRMSEYVKLSLAATTLAVRDAGLDGSVGESDAASHGPRTPALLGTTHGSAAYCEQYYRQIVDEGIDAANPMLFAEGVPNAGAAHLSLAFGLTGPCQTLIGSRTAGLEALRLAALRIHEGRWSRAIVSAGEEATPVIQQAYQHCGLAANNGEGGAGGNGNSTGREGHDVIGASGNPFEPMRGFIIGPGAVTLMLESRAAAEARGVQPYGRIEATASGFARASDPRASRDRLTDMLAALGDPDAVITSANSTWLSRIEAAALAARHRDASGEPRATTITSLYGHIAETFSVTPLAGLVAGLLTRRLPDLHGPAPHPAALQPAAGDHCRDRFAVLAGDYDGGLAGAGIRV